MQGGECTSKYRRLECSTKASMDEKRHAISPVDAQLCAMDGAQWQSIAVFLCRILTESQKLAIGTHLSESLRFFPLLDIPQCCTILVVQLLDFKSLLQLRSVNRNWRTL